MDIAFQNTRGAVSATARRLARESATIEFIADEYGALLRTGTYPPGAAFTLVYKAYWTGELTSDQIQRLAAGGLTVTEGATMTIPEILDRFAQRVLIRGAWWRVVQQVSTEGVTNFTLDKIAAEPGGVYE